MKQIFLFILILSLAACVSKEQKAIDAISAIEKTFYADSMNSPEPMIARNLITAYTDFAKTYPKHVSSPDYLFRSAEIANGILRNPNEALEHYAKVCSNYPEHEKASTSLFLQGFIFENYLKNPENAKKYYTEFLQKYPNHKLAGDVKFSIDHLGMSDEELIKMFDEKNAQVAN